jgi:hypothetical protein
MNFPIPSDSDDPAEARKAVLSRCRPRGKVQRGPVKPTQGATKFIAWCLFACGFVLGALVGLAMANVLRKW